MSKKDVEPSHFVFRFRCKVVTSDCFPFCSVTWHNSLTRSRTGVESLEARTTIERDSEPLNFVKILVKIGSKVCDDAHCAPPWSGRVWLCFPTLLAYADIICGSPVCRSTAAARKKDGITCPSFRAVQPFPSSPLTELIKVQHSRSWVVAYKIQ